MILISFLNLIGKIFFKIFSKKKTYDDGLPELKYVSLGVVIIILFFIVLGLFI